MKTEYGIRGEHMEDAIEIYTIAFESKYLYFLENKERMKRMIRPTFNPSPAIVVVSEDNKLMGFAAFYTENEMLFNLTVSAFVQEFGFFKGLYKILLFWLIFRRKVNQDELYIDHIVVAPEFRNRGVGKLLFAELEQFAANNSYKYLGLDVIDENPDALRLYQSLNFEISRHQDVPNWIAKLIGTKGVTSMLKGVNAHVDF